MMLRAGSKWSVLVGALVCLCIIGLSAPAQARGSVRLGSTTVDEKDGKWKLKLTIDYGAMPHLAHIPMVFTFTQTALYERSLTDESPDKPIERTVPIQNATPINLPVDVGFADMSGKMFKVTKFTLPLTREADFEAGEYTLKVKLASGGTPIGGATKIRLTGKNKIINRKAIEFKASEPKEKKGDNTKPPGDDFGDEGGGPKAAEDMGPNLDDIPDYEGSDEPVESPDGVKPKQGGCGCVTAPTNERWGWLSLVAIGAVWLVRRRR